MKTFISALIIFMLLFSLVIASAFYVQDRAEALLSLAYSLPESSEDFDGASERKEKTLALLSLWKKSERGLAYIICRDVTDKAGEAAGALLAAAEAGSAEDFLPARLRFIAAIERIALLFSVSAESIL
jgi:hypothetical protein